MGAMMAKNRNPKVTHLDKTTLKVKLLRDTVKCYLRKTEQSVQYEQDLAIQLLQRGLRERAKCILRKQLVLVQHLKATDRRLEILEDTINTLETTGLQDKILDGLRAGNLALRQAHEVLNIKNVGLILEETVRAIEKQEEINRSVTVLDVAKSEDLLSYNLDRELENLTENSSPTVAFINGLRNEKAEERTPQGRSFKGRFKKQLPASPDVVPKPSTSALTSTKARTKESSKSKKKATAGFCWPKETGIVIYN